MSAFEKSEADYILYVFRIVPRGLHTAAQITIKQVESSYIVRLEWITAPYTHYGFVGTDDFTADVRTWEEARIVANALAAKYERVVR